MSWGDVKGWNNIDWCINMKLCSLNHLLRGYCYTDGHKSPSSLSAGRIIFICGCFSKLFCLICKENFEHCRALLLLFKENQAYSRCQYNCSSSPIYKGSFCVEINCKTFLGLLYTFGNSKNLMFRSMCW